MMDQAVQAPQRPLTFLNYAQMNRGVGESEDVWQDLARRVREGKIVPILSNSLRDERFMRLFNQPDRSLASFIAESWATAIGYPMNDTDNLARGRPVSPGYGCQPRESQARLSGLHGAGADGLCRRVPIPLAAAVIEEKNLANTPDLLFADLVSELGYPPQQDDEEDLMTTAGQAAAADLHHHQLLRFPGAGIDRRRSQAGTL